MSKNSKILLIGGGCFLLAACVLAIIAIALGLIIYEGNEVIAGIPATSVTEPVEVTAFPSTSSGVPLTPSPAFPATGSGIAATPTPLPLVTPAWQLDSEVPAEIQQQPISPSAYESLNQLKTVPYPINDYHAAALRLSATDPGPRTITAPQYEVGDTQRFITDSGEINGTLAVVGDYTYFWVDEELVVDVDDLEVAQRIFEEEYYPILLTQFGEIWQPGMDGDPRFSILHLTQFEDESEIGFFDSGDEYPNSINSSSNEQEIVYMNMEFLAPGDEEYLGTLTHETQHLIQWHIDANEETWMDEGLAQLAETMAGLDSVNTYNDWLETPSIRLNTWEYEDDESVYAHYGAGYLLMLYFWEQLGDEAAAELAQHPANGLAAVEAVLTKYQPQKPLAEFMADWATAAFLDDEKVDDLFQFQNLHLGRPDLAAIHKNFPQESTSALAQYGVHYIDIRHNSSTLIEFAGDSMTPLLPVPPASGEHVWLAPIVDNLDAQLTLNLNLTNVEQASLEFKAWYNLEAEWDFAYVTISDDGGMSWSLLTPKHRTAGEFGPGFNGNSSEAIDAVAGWVSESIPLTRFVGREVLVRFEVLTDSAINLGGFAIDDIEVPALNYKTTLENDISEWTASGFVLTGWQLPQDWTVRLIDNDSKQVVTMALNPLNQGQLALDLGPKGGTLVIMPQSMFGYMPAHYWLKISEGD